MNSITRISAAIVLVTLSMVIGVTSVRAAPEKPQLGTTIASPLLSNLLNVANTIGNDQFSTVDLTTQADPSSTSTQHYGPYASGSTDSGTCGNDWANDLFNRHFTVFSQKDGSMVVVEQFKDGSFTTPASDSPQPNPSPGGCQTSALPAGFVADGITGQLHGYFIIPMPSTVMQTSNDPHCDAVGMTNANCDTTTFINTHFTPCYPGTCSVTTFFFHYAAGDQGLISHEWTNASPDRGGNRGDIRSN